MECPYGGAGSWFCAAHALNHGCRGELVLPVVNSPRVGVCAYTGDEPFDYEQLTPAADVDGELDEFEEQ